MYIFCLFSVSSCWADLTENSGVDTAVTAGGCSVHPTILKQWGIEARPTYPLEHGQVLVGMNWASSSRFSTRQWRGLRCDSELFTGPAQARSGAVLLLVSSSEVGIGAWAPPRSCRTVAKLLGLLFILQGKFLSTSTFFWKILLAKWYKIILMNFRLQIIVN